MTNIENVEFEKPYEEETLEKSILNLPDFITVKTKFEASISSIGYIFNSTGESNTVAISNGKLQMMQNRTYYIPVNTSVDSDIYNIKVLSDIADKLDVRFVKDGFACIVPLQHNITIKNEQKICVLTK